MLQRLADQLTLQFSHRKGGVLGWYAKKLFLKYNTGLIKSAVDLCDIKPDHRVLEVGFGPGVGLKRTYNKIKDGTGMVCGVDISEKMFFETAEKLEQEIRKKKIELVLTGVERMPFNSNTFDRVYHVNCYYFWRGILDGAAELYRVMKPNSLMVTTLNLKAIEGAKKHGLLVKNVNTDPMNYMWCLETVGFQDVSIKYLKGTTGKTYEAIFAYIHEKPERSFASEEVSGSSIEHEKS